MIRTLGLLALIGLLGHVAQVSAEREIEPEETASHIVTGTVSKVFTRDGGENYEYIVLVRIDGIEKGEGYEEGGYIHAYVFDRKPDAPREEAASGHSVIPKEGQRIRARIKRENGYMEGLYPFWCDVLEPISRDRKGIESASRPEQSNPARIASPPVFAFCHASSGLSTRDFGLDGPHMLTYVTISSPDLQWTAKDKSRAWRFDQPHPSDTSSVMIYLGGPTWHWKEQSRFVRANGKRVDESELPKLLEKPTPILVSLTGNPLDESFVKLLNPETMVLLLGPRDRELRPRIVDSAETEQSHAPEPSVGPASH